MTPTTLAEVLAGICRQMIGDDPDDDPRHDFGELIVPLTRPSEAGGFLAAALLAELDAARVENVRLREWLKTCRDALDSFAGIAPIPDRPSLRILKEKP